MVVRTLLLAAIAVALASTAALAEGEERACRTIEMRLMQLMASGKADGSEAQSVRSMLSSRGCGGGGRSARAKPKRGAIQRPAVAARPVLTARPARARKTARSDGPAILAKAARREPMPDSPRRRSRPAAADPQPRISVAGGTFRTWCVRTCDGYFFPISYSTTRDHFESDQATCQSMCPAAKASLFFHDADDGGPENMTSLKGEAYADLSSAFKFRKALDRSCTCTTGGTRPLPELEPAPAEATLAQAPLPPNPRPAPGEDPETLANRAGHFIPGPGSQNAVAMADSSLGQSVRVVWPDWQAQQSEVMISAVPGY